jgi:hypothetical protein
MLLNLFLELDQAIKMRISSLKRYGRANIPPASKPEQRDSGRVDAI